MRPLLIATGVLLMLPLIGCDDDDDDDDRDELDAGMDAAPPADAGDMEDAAVDAAVPGAELLQEAFDAQLVVTDVLADPELVGDPAAIRDAIRMVRDEAERALELTEMAVDRVPAEAQDETRAALQEMRMEMDLAMLILMPDTEMLPLRFAELKIHGGVAVLSLNQALHALGLGPSAPGAGHILAEEELILPEGYTAEILVNGLSFASVVAVGDDGTLFVGEAGFAYGGIQTDARVLRIVDGTTEEVAAGFDPPLAGIAVADGSSSRRMRPPTGSTSHPTPPSRRWARPSSPSSAT